MAVTSYSTTPASNTSIGTVNIAEQCPAGNANDAIRQLMADVKTESDYTRTQLANLTATASNYEDTFPNAYEATLPLGVTATTITAGGSGYTDGTYALGVSGGPTGFAGTYTVSGGAVTAITITNAGLSTSSTAPTLSFPSGGGTGATATATVSSLIPNQTSYWVASSDSKYILLVKNEAGTATAVDNPDGTQVAIPNRTALDDILADMSPWANYSSLTTYPTLGNLKKLILHGAAGADLYVSIFFRDSAAGNRFNLIISDSGGQVAGVAAGGSIIDPTGFTGLKWISIVELNSSGITGAALVDFGAGANFVDSYSYTSPATDLSTATTQLSDAETGNIESIADAQAQAAIALRATPHPVWIADVADDYLRTFVTKLKVEQGDPGHDYILNYQTQLIGGTTYRAKLRLYDVTLGAIVAEWAREGATDFSGTEPETLFLTKAADGTTSDEYVIDPTPYYGVTATVWVDWSSVDWTKGLTSYTTYSQAGIRPENVVSTEEVVRRYFNGPEPARIITVGATGCDYTTVVAAVESLHDIDGLTVTTSSFPMSNSCTFSHQVMIQVVDDNWEEDLAGVVVPHFCTIRGLGPGNTTLTATGSPTTPRVAEMSFSGRFQNCTLRQDGGGYVVHVDNVNAISKRATSGPAILRHRNIAVFEDVRFESSGTGSSDWMIGTGLSNGQILAAKRCQFVRSGAGTGAAIGVHNSPSTTDPGLVWVEDCYFNSGSQPVSLLTSFAQDHPHTVVIKSSDTDGTVGAANSSGGSEAFVRSGNWQGITYDSELDPA